MPVRKSSLRLSGDEEVTSHPVISSTTMSKDCDSCEPHQACDRHSRWCGWMGRKLLATFVGILLVYLIVFLGALIRNELKKHDFIGEAGRMERTIRVDGVGKVSVKPDIAMTTMGVTNEAATVAEAQMKNTEIANQLVARVKQLGIEDADIQTRDYTVYPAYDYTDGTSELRGYTVSQNVVVKIRDLSKANQVIGLAGEVGATNVSGLQFTIDDRDAYLAEARMEALKKAAEKAQALSNMLGLRLVSIVSYDEYEDAGYDPYYTKNYDMEAMSGSVAPQIEAGTEDVVLHVGVTYELK